MKDATSTLDLDNQREVLEGIPRFLPRLIRKIFGLDKEPAYSYPKQSEFEKAYKTIRMAQNYGESYEAMKARIKDDSARYTQFKKHPQPIGKITLNTRQLDSDEEFEQYVVNVPDERKASVSQTYQRCADIVLEFILHDERGEPLFPIARAYGDWIGYKEFDLGRDRAFYLSMIEVNPGEVLVQAGFKAKKAPVPATMLPEAASGTSGRIKHALGMADSWLFKKLVPAAMHVTVIVLYFSLFNVTANTNPTAGPNAATNTSSEKATQHVPGTMHAVQLPMNNGDDGLTFGGEITGPRNDRLTSTTKHFARISSFTVTVNSTSFDESVRCGRELVSRIKKGVDANSFLKDSNCGSGVNFVFSYEPLERNENNFLLNLLKDRPSFFDNEYDAYSEGVAMTK